MFYIYLVSERFLPRDLTLPAVLLERCRRCQRGSQSFCTRAQEILLLQPDSSQDPELPVLHDNKEDTEQQCFNIYSWNINSTTKVWQIENILTCERRRGSLCRNGHHEEVFSLSLHHDEVVIVPQHVWSEAHREFAAHSWGNNAALTGEYPCKPHLKIRPFLHHVHVCGACPALSCLIQQGAPVFA